MDAMSQMGQIEMGPPATNGKHQLSIINKRIIKIASPTRKFGGNKHKKISCIENHSTF